VDPKYIANPLTKEDVIADSSDDDSPSRGWGSRQRFSVTQRRSPEPVRKPEPIRRTEPVVVRRVQPVPPRDVDPNFEPTPILQLRAGQRIEHNRFGFGQILEISGTPADLKAKITFDDHGEKTLILKYAKIRVV
jgi:DNA helicase-2/ATP-dependent DNA helicase PcrA